MPQVDDPDLAIAQLLQRDGRASLAALSRATGLAANTVAGRLARLLDSRELRIVTLTGANAAATPVLAHVSVQLTGPVLPLGVRLARSPAVSFATLTVGRYPMVVELRCADRDQLRSELERLRAVRGVTALDVVLADELVRDAYRTTSQRREIRLDDVDERLVEALRTDGRASYVALGSATGLSASAARARLLRLRRTGNVHVTALLPHSRLQSMARLGLGITVDGATPRTVAQSLLDLPGSFFVMTGVGRFDVVVGLDAPGDDAALAWVDRIRRARGVATVETWRHHEVLRENYE